jgi:hypothetical protein
MSRTPVAVRTVSALRGHGQAGVMLKESKGLLLRKNSAITSSTDRLQGLPECGHGDQRAKVARYRNCSQCQGLFKAAQASSHETVMP